MKEMHEKADMAAQFLKSLANSTRLMILCLLVEGEKSVSQLIEATEIGQSSISQHLSKLKEEGIIDFRRDHRTLYYYINDTHALRIMGVLYDIFCKEDNN